MFIPYYNKSTNTLTNQGTHNLPLSNTLELWEVLTWLLEGIRSASHQYSLLGPFFLCFAGVVVIACLPCRSLLIFYHHQKAKERERERERETLVKACFYLLFSWCWVKTNLNFWRYHLTLGCIKIFFQKTKMINPCEIDNIVVKGPYVKWILGISNLI